MTVTINLKSLAKVSRMITDFVKWDDHIDYSVLMYNETSDYVKFVVTHLPTSKIVLDMSTMPDVQDGKN